MLQSLQFYNNVDEDEDTGLIKRVKKNFLTHFQKFF